MKSDREDHYPDFPWPDPGRFKRSIRFQLALVVSLLMTALLMATGYGLSKLYVDSVTKAEVEQLLVEARSFSAPTGKLMIAGNQADDLLLQNVCKKLKTENEDIFWVGIADNSGRFKAHTDIAKVVSGETIESLPQADFAQLARESEEIHLSGDSLFVNVPIRENGVTLGTLSLASSSDAIGDARRASLIAIMSILLIMLPLSVVVPTAVLSKKLKPIKTIADGLKSINFDNGEIEIRYSSQNELGFLAETLRTMGGRLQVARRELAERERMARELEIAREIQLSILPKTVPQSPRYSIAAEYRSAKEVGGDYYDFINLGRGRIGMIVADVSGKSLPGMLVMLLTRDLVKNHALEAKNPRDLLCKVNENLYGSIRDGMFVTMFYGILDEEHGTFSFASAGHNPIILLRRGGTTTGLIKTKGFPLAMMPPDVFAKRLEQQEIVLQGGDLLIQYTDGITEAQNLASEEFRIERLVEAARSGVESPPGQIVKRIISRVDEFAGDAEQYDDITLVAVQWAISAGFALAPDTQGVANV